MITFHYSNININFMTNTSNFVKSKFFIFVISNFSDFKLELISVFLIHHNVAANDFVYHEFMCNITIDKVYVYSSFFMH